MAGSMQLVVGTMDDRLAEGAVDRRWGMRRSNKVDGAILRVLMPPKVRAGDEFLLTATSD